MATHMFRVHLWHFRVSRHLLLPPRCRCLLGKIRAECGSGHTRARLICRRNPDFRHTSTNRGCTARCCSGTSTRCTLSLKKENLSFEYKQLYLTKFMLK